MKWFSCLGWCRDNMSNYNINQVDVNNILMTVTHNIHRTSLFIPLLNYDNKKLNVLTILMNPSDATDKISDPTVNNVIKYFYKQNYKSITVCNIFPFYQPQSQNLYKCFIAYNLRYSILKSNMIKVKQEILNADEIVIGYGDCPSDFPATVYYDQISKVLNYILNSNKILYVFSYTKKNKNFTKYNNPYHPGRGTIDGIIKITIDSSLILR